MSAKFKIGDTIWLARYGRQEVLVPCNVCYGKKEVTLILGNDDSVILPCEACGHGFRAPTGTQTEYTFVCGAEQCRITGMRIEISSDRESVTYDMLGGCYADESKCFATEEEAMLAAEALRKAEDERENTQAAAIKANAQRSFIWNAHHHMSEFNRAMRDAEYHARKAELCKARIPKKTVEELKP